MKYIPYILGFVKPYKKMVALYLLFIILSTLFALFSFGMLAPVLQVLFNGEEQSSSVQAGTGIIAQVSAMVNDFILQFDKWRALLYTVILVVAATVLKNLFLYLALYILNPIKNQVLRQLRSNLFNKTLSLPIGFFTEERKGDLVSRMTNDINEVEISVVSVLETVIREPITILLTVVMMVWISPSMTLFMLLFLPIAGLIIGKVSKTLKRPSEQAQGLLGHMLTHLDETISSMRVVKAFGAEAQQRKKFEAINNDLYVAKNKIAARREAGSPMSETLGIIVVGVILLYGGHLIFSNQGSLTGPFFVVFIGFFFQLISPLKSLSHAFYKLQQGKAAMDRVQEILKTPTVIDEVEHPVYLKDFSEQIEFRNVCFSYGDKPILKNISFKVPKGKTVALVGASGAGKSTIADLIPRFHDVNSGAVLVDGVDVRSLSLKSYRKLIGMVGQEPILFNDTIAANICLGVEGGSDAAIQSVASVANAHDFIQKKQEGYQTVVGDRGTKLSGGERQRVTIARALMKNPPILILDEATSSLDTESERLVQEAINKLMKNRTAVVIAHRLSTIQYADEIIVLDQGEIVERGTHETLMHKAGGYYANLVAMQQFK